MHKSLSDSLHKINNKKIGGRSSSLTNKSGGNEKSFLILTKHSCLWLTVDATVADARVDDRDASLIVEADLLPSFVASETSGTNVTIYGRANRTLFIVAQISELFTSGARLGDRAHI